MACALISGSTCGFFGLATASNGTPRATRSSSAHTGTGGSGAAASAAAAEACAKAALKASHTTSNCAREASSSGGNLASTLGQLASFNKDVACSCQWSTSACKASTSACASRHDLVDSTSMRWASNTAASRCTCTRCCKSSITFTRSLSWPLSVAKGSLLKGAPALAASRCQAMASAIFSLATASKTCALSAHSCAMDSWPLLRLISSSFSRSSLAAPLSLPLISLNTACICSGLGAPANQSRIRAVRSVEVWAENAPPVSASSGWGAFDLAGICVTSGATAVFWRAEKGNMSRTNKENDPRRVADRVETLFSPLFTGPAITLWGG